MSEELNLKKLLKGRLKGEVVKINLDFNEFTKSIMGRDKEKHFLGKIFNKVKVRSVNNNRRTEIKIMEDL